MRRQLFASLIISVVVSLFGGSIAGAQSLEIHPTIYQDIHLERGERKKAFVDVRNLSATTQVISMKVQAFRQVDDNGALAFYDNEQVAKGVLLDLTEFELRGGEAIRVYFLMDGTKLPEGDVFAAIFAQTSPPKEAAAQSIQVGSLLTITNGTPASHTADVSSLQVGQLQVGEAITARFSLTNPADEHRATGFFPSVTVRTWPYDQRVVRGPLLFAGRTRTIDYRQPGNYIGIIRLEVDAGGKKSSHLLFVMTGIWRWLAPLIVVVGAVIAILILRRLNIVPLKRRIPHS
jgi:hypothetical protein